VAGGRLCIQIPDKSRDWPALGAFEALDGCLVCAHAAGEQLKAIATTIATPS